MEGKPLPVNASLPWMKWAWVRARVHVTALSPNAPCGDCAGNSQAQCMAAKTGHAMEKEVSTLFHYFSPNSSLILMVPGNLILGGWPGIPHGKLGAGAKCASLKPIIAKLMPASVPKLRAFVNQILCFHQGYTPTNLFDGELRPMADAMGATLVMHYEISAKYYEIEATRVLMCTSLATAGLADNPLQAHTRLCEWGELVKVALPQ